MSTPTTTPPIVPATSGVNVSPFDRFSLLHMLTGYLAGRAGANPVLYMAMNVGWELVEDGLKDLAPQLFPAGTHDSKANALGDVWCGFMGYAVGLAVRGGS